MRNKDFSIMRSAVTGLKAELGRKPFRQMKPERAFIGWYVLARYGKDTTCEITDGPKDGGIDAIATEGAITVVIQSKYESSLQLRTASPQEVAAFEAMVSRLRDESQLKVFEKWLTTVRPELQQKYKSVRRLAIHEPHRVRFDFVTTKRVSTVLDETFNVVDLDRIAPLWSLYEEGFTPPVEKVSVEFEDLWSTGAAKDAFRNYVGLADVRAFLRLMDNDTHERLFAQNVRTDLRTRVNRTIRDTYESEPDTFWLGNNGLYIVCSRANQTGRTLNLVYPSIINGSQTLHAIHSSTAPRHPCRILVRVLEMDTLGQRGLLNAIVRRTNTQNPMKAMNLAAHDSEQLFIARYLDGLQVFYERREKEWRNEKRSILNGYIVVSMKELAQWSGVTTGDIGLGTARARVATLFMESQYKKLFGRFGDNLGVEAYQDLAASVFAGLLVKRFLRSLTKSHARQKITHLLLVRLAFEAIVRSQPLFGRVQEFVRDRRFSVGTNRHVANSLSNAMKAALREQLAQERSGEATDLSNFFKRDDLTEIAYKKAASGGRLDAIERTLQKALIE
jgi:AIPR protein